MKIAVLVSALVIGLITPATDTYLSQEIQDACIKYGEEYSICPELLMAMVEKESSGRPKVKSNDGSCIGLMQVNPKWHKDRMERLDAMDLTDIDDNIHVGADYLSELAEEYEDIGYVLDKYNGNSKADYNAENGILSKYSKWILDRAEELERARGKKDD